MDEKKSRQSTDSSASLTSLETQKSVTYVLAAGFAGAFELFNKLDTNSKGTGVGLALVKRIIEVHSGRICIVSNRAGEGTTFYFTLSAKSLISKKLPLTSLGFTGLILYQYRIKDASSV